jgi:hypothetical protein
MSYVVVSSSLEIFDIWYSVTGLRGVHCRGECQTHICPVIQMQSLHTFARDTSDELIEAACALQTWSHKASERRLGNVTVFERLRRTGGQRD